MMKMNSFNKRVNSKGFTLLELIMVLGIAGILVSVAVPSFADLLSANKVSGAAEKIKADFEWARSIAIRNNADIYMDVSAGTSSWCYGFTDAATCDCSQTSAVASDACTVDGSLKRNTQSPYGNTALASTISYMTFKSRGLMAAAGGTLSLSLGSKTVTLEISRLGRSTICSSQLNQFPSC